MEQQQQTQADAEKDKFMETFKEVYKERGSYHLQSQVGYLAALADYYYQKGAEKKDWVCLLKAHALYNSVSVRDGENENKWSVKAFQVQKTCWGEDIQFTYEQQKEITDCMKRKLTEVRESTRSKLDYIKANFISFDCDKLICRHNDELYQKFIEESESTSEHCTDGMVKVLNHVVDTAVEITGNQPCKFCTVALGSIARGEATPYSDLEFLFLIETGSSHTVMYFEKLALTIYFLIGNLRETPLKYMAIEELCGWFEDVTVSGLKIDGLQPQAGSIPTGNGSEKQRNHFICTVNELFTKYEMAYKNPDPIESLGGDLTAMLSCTAPVFGDTKLLIDFKAKLEHLKPIASRQAATMKMLENDSTKYKFYPDESLSRQRNLKSDIYRYPSMLRLNLKILHQLGQSCPEIIHELTKKGILSRSVANYLRFTLASALYIRLSAYLYHGSQNNSISVLHANGGFFRNTRQWYVDRSLLLHTMMHLIPLQRAVKEGNLETNITATAVEHDISVAVTSYYCADYVTCYVKLSNLQLNTESLQREILLANCMVLLGKFSEAKTTYKNCLRLLEEEHKDEGHSDRATLYCSLGDMAMREGHQLGHSDTPNAHLFDVRRRVHSPNMQPTFAHSQRNWALYQQARQYYSKSLNLAVSVYGNSDHPIKADCYTGLGNAAMHDKMSQPGSFSNAVTYHKLALSMRQRLYRDSDHPDIAASYDNMGSAYAKTENSYALAKTFHTMALSMRQRLYGNSDHPDVADSLYNLGLLMKKQGFSRNVYLSQSLAMRERLKY